MLRFLFILLAIVAAIMAYIFEEPLFYAAAGLLVLFGIYFAVQYARKRHRQAQPSYVRSTGKPHEEDLSTFGITEIKPRTKTTPSRQPAGGPSAESAGEKEEESRELLDDLVDQVRSAEKTTVTADEEEEAAPAPASAPSSQSEHHFDRAVLPFLQSLQEVTQVNTVCLIMVDRTVSECRVEVGISKLGQLQLDTRFNLSDHFLSQVSSERPVTVLSIREGDLRISDLIYYKQPMHVKQVIVSPVQGPQGVSAFLVADSAADEGIPARQRTLFGQAGHLISLMLEDWTKTHGEAPFAAERKALNGASRGRPGKAERPRREIIEEEMQRAREHEQPLALALVYANDAESISREGKKSVKAAENALLVELNRLTTDGRVERFGELMFGVFLHGGFAAVEEWVDEVRQINVAAAGHSLKVSIGVAMLGGHHNAADDLREDAVRALKEAYETGQTTIYE